MKARIAAPHMLALNALHAAFTLVSKRTATTDLQGTLDVNRRLLALNGGRIEAMSRTIDSLNILAHGPDFSSFRSATSSLALSLPVMCNVDVTAAQLNAAARDVTTLAAVAEQLNSPETARALLQIAESILQLRGAARAPGTRTSMQWQ